MHYRTFELGGVYVSLPIGIIGAIAQAIKDQNLQIPWTTVKQPLRATKAEPDSIAEMAVLNVELPKWDITPEEEDMHRQLREDAIPLTYRGWAALYRPELLHERTQGPGTPLTGTVARTAKIILKQRAPTYEDDPELTRTFGSSLAGLMTILHKPDGPIYAATLAEEDLAASAAVIDDPHATTTGGNPELS